MPSTRRTCPGEHLAVARGSATHSTPALPRGDELAEAIRVAIHQGYDEASRGAAQEMGNHGCKAPCVTFFRLRKRTRQPIPHTPQPNRRAIATVTVDWKLDVVCKRAKDLPPEILREPGEPPRRTALPCPGVHRSVVIGCGTTPPRWSNSIDEMTRSLEADAVARAMGNAVAATIGIHCAQGCDRLIRVREAYVTDRSIQGNSTEAIMAGGSLYFGYATACAYLDILCE